MCDELGQHERRCLNCGISYHQGATSMSPACPLCEQRRDRKQLERRVGALEDRLEAVFGEAANGE